MGLNLTWPGAAEGVQRVAEEVGSVMSMMVAAVTAFGPLRPIPHRCPIDGENAAAAVLHVAGQLFMISDSAPPGPERSALSGPIYGPTL